MTGSQSKLTCLSETGHLTESASKAPTLFKAANCSTPLSCYDFNRLREVPDGQPVWHVACTIAKCRGNPGGTIICMVGERVARDDLQANRAVLGFEEGRSTSPVDGAPE